MSCDEEDGLLLKTLAAIPVTSTAHDAACDASLVPVRCLSR